MGIGVTEFISRQEVRDRINRDFPNPGSDVEGKLGVSHVSYEHSLLGQAFDYLIRIWLEAKCETVKDPYESHGFGGNWTDSIGYSPSRYADGYDQNDREDFSDDELDAKIEALDRAEKKHDQFVKTGVNANDAIDASLVFSGLDQNVGLDDGTIQANSFEDDVLAELQDLFNLLREQDDLIGDTVILSPLFGERSFILEGRADFIVDDMLIDVKATEDPTFKPDYWRQLLAYYVLNDIHREIVANGIDTRGSDVSYPNLSEVGVYFARYGEFKTIDVTKYLRPREKYERFRAWFVDRAIEQNHDGRINYDPFRELLTDPYDYEDQTSLSDF